MHSKGPLPPSASASRAGSPCGPDFLAGISVGSELLDLMTFRYSDSSGKVSFPSLACFLIRLEAMASKCHLGDILEAFTVMERAQKRTRKAPLPQAWARLQSWGGLGSRVRSSCPKRQSHR